MKSTIKLIILSFILCSQTILFGSSAAGSGAGMPPLEQLKPQPLGVFGINRQQLIQSIDTKIKLLAQIKTTGFGGFTDDQFARAIKMIGEGKIQIFIVLLDNNFKPDKQTSSQQENLSRFKKDLVSNLPANLVHFFQQFLLQFNPQALAQLSDETLILLNDSLYSIDKALQQIQISDQRLVIEAQANYAHQILQAFTHQLLNAANQQRQQLHLPVSQPQLVAQPVAGTFPQAKAPLQQNWMQQPLQQFWTAPAAPFVPQQLVTANHPTPVTASAGLTSQQNIAALQQKQILAPAQSVPTASAAPIVSRQVQVRVLQPSQRQLAKNIRNDEEKKSMAATTENPKLVGASAAAAAGVMQTGSVNSAPPKKEDIAKVEALFAQLFNASQNTIPSLVIELKDQIRNIAFPSEEQKKAFDSMRNQANQQVIDFEKQVREFQKIVTDNPKIAKMKNQLSPSSYEGWAEAEAGFDHALTEFKKELTNLGLNPQETRDLIRQILEPISLWMPYFICETQYKKMIPFFGQQVPIELIARRTAQGFYRASTLIDSLDRMNEKDVAKQTSIDTLKMLNRFEEYFNPATNVYKYIQARISADKMLEIQKMLDFTRKYLVNRAQQ